MRAARPGDVYQHSLGHVFVYIRPSIDGLDHWYCAKHHDSHHEGTFWPLTGGGIDDLLPRLTYLFNLNDTIKRVV